MKLKFILLILVAMFIFTRCQKKEESSEAQGLMEYDSADQQSLELPAEAKNNDGIRTIEVMDGTYSNREIMVNSNGLFSQYLAQDLPAFQSVDRIESDDRTVGYGYNEITGTWCGKCIEAAALQAVDTALQTQIKITRVKDFFDLKEQLKFDAQASIRYGLFSSDMSYSRFASKNISKLAQYLLVQASVEKSPEILTDPKFSQVGSDNIKSSYKNFINACGTQFVIGRVQGGKLYALVEIVSSSEQEFTSTSGKIDASLGPFGSSSASFKNMLESISQSSSIKTTLIKSGGSDEIVTDIDQIVQKINSFPAEVRANPKTLYLQIQSYSGVLNYPNSFKREQIDWIKNKFDVIASFLDKCYAFRSDIIFVKTYPSAFDPNVISKLDSMYKDNEEQIGRYLEFARKLQNDFMTKKRIKAKDYPVPVPPKLVNLEFLPGWSLPRVPVIVSTRGQQIVTINRHEVRCYNRCPCRVGDGKYWFDRYAGSLTVSSPQYTFINPRIICRSGACGWNAGNGVGPNSVWISPDGKTLNWNFCASSASTYYDIYADEVKYVIMP